MFYSRITGLLFLAVTIVMACNACAQWSPGGMMVYMGDLNLAGSSGAASAGGAAPYILGSIHAARIPENNSSANNSSLSEGTTGASSAAAIEMSSLAASGVSSAATAGTNGLAATGSSGLEPLDLSHYGSDRVSRDLAKYRNIMYPIAESRGSTASTSGGSGGGCSCG